MMSNNPLVTVGILTYNSSKYVIDALESVKDQTYREIELIVSDDGSSDNTVAICNNWIDKNRNRFKNVNLCTVEKNTGTAANYNRCLAASHGLWFKIFAGDDALCPNCIADFIDFSINHPDAQWIVGKFVEYKDTFEASNIIKFHDSYNDNSDFLSLPAEQQFQKMLYGNTFILPIAAIIQTEALRSVGGCDEKYGILEDFPLFLKLLKAGIRCVEMKKVVGKYRSSETCVWGNTNVLFNYRHKQLHYQVKKDMCFPYFSLREKTREASNFYCYKLMHILHRTRKTSINIRLLQLLQIGFSLITFDWFILKKYIDALLLKIRIKRGGSISSHLL